MKILLQWSALCMRGVLYYLFFYIPYKFIMLPNLRDTSIIKTIHIEDVSYKLRLKPSLGGISEDLSINLIREYPNVLYFKDYIRRYASTLITYIGIGANIGYYALLTRNIVRKAGGKGNIYALEPVKSTFERFKYNIGLNKAHDIRTLNIGVGDKDVRANMVVMRRHNLSKVQDTTILPKEGIIKIEKVTLYTLATLFARYRIPKNNVLFRCDIEGYEYQLIKGNIKFLKQIKNAHIIMEFHPFFLHAKKSIEILRSLQSAGYKLQQVISCEPAYFLRMPAGIRKLLIALFLFQHGGEALGKIDSYQSIDDLITDLKDEHNALYIYPHLHFYFANS